MSIEDELAKLSPEDRKAMEEYIAFRKARANKKVTDLPTDNPDTTPE